MKSDRRADPFRVGVPQALANHPRGRRSNATTGATCRPGRSAQAPPPTSTSRLPSPTTSASTSRATGTSPAIRSNRGQRRMPDPPRRPQRRSPQSPRRHDRTGHGPVGCEVAVPQRPNAETPRYVGVPAALAAGDSPMSDGPPPSGYRTIRTTWYSPPHPHRASRDPSDRASVSRSAPHR